MDEKPEKGQEIEAPSSASNDKEDYEAAPSSTADYANYEPPDKRRNPIWRKLAIGLVALVVLLSLAGAAYWFIKNRQSTNEPASNADTVQNGNQLAQAASQITAKTKHYVSQNFRLEFDYPEDWTASDDNSEEISVLSPDIKLTSTEGQPVIGQIYFRVRANGQKLQGLEGGNATAVRASVKIAYTKPTQVQRDSTYISLLRYAGTMEGLDGVYITGDLGYQKDQAIPEIDIEKVNPIISIEFYRCPDSGCVEVSGINGIGVASWDDKNISGPLESMLKSLVIN